MTAMICPHCGSYATFTVVYQTGQFSTRNKWQSGGNSTTDAAFQCNNPDCALIIGGIVSAADNKTIVDHWPHHAVGKEFPDVPETIAAAADEAYRCLSIGAHRAAIATARAVVEATAKHHDVTKGNLENKIDELAKKGVIGNDTAEAAHAVRLWGNDAAHGDLALTEVDEQDAREVVALMDDVLSRAYQLPARTRRIIESRQARRNGD